MGEMQMVIVRKRSHRGFEDIAWGKVVGGSKMKPLVQIDGCVPDILTGKPEYPIGQVVEIRRTDGLFVGPGRPPCTGN
jgi:hypothetical protein